MYIYVVSRDTNRTILNDMDSGKIPYDEKIEQYVVNNWNDYQREIGYFENLQEAINAISEDADLYEQNGVPKKALWYGIVKRDLGSCGYVNFDIWRDNIVNGVTYTVFGKEEAD